MVKERATIRFYLMKIDKQYKLQHHFFVGFRWTSLMFPLFYCINTKLISTYKQPCGHGSPARGHVIRVWISTYKQPCGDGSLARGHVIRVWISTYKQPCGDGSFARGHVIRVWISTYKQPCGDGSLARSHVIREWISTYKLWGWVTHLYHLITSLIRLW